MSTESSDLLAMGRKGRDWMRDDFSWEKIGIQMVDTYKWLRESGPKPEYVVLD